ncbi:HipA-like protein [Lachnospiraceae bacterium JC7]|nr:HipA-like protein [Lachnospiraceae bacterium JC7]
MRCLCCNKEIVNPSEYENTVTWHQKCIKSFFGTQILPELDCTEKELEQLVNSTVNKGLTVPGVQKKLSLHLHSEGRNARLTIVDYPTGYILKPQSDDFRHLPEAEFITMKMASKAKIKTVSNALIYINGKYSYITKRIDRLDKQLFAMEDFCQLSGRLTEDKYKGSYENCGKIINRYSQNIGIDKSDFFYRLVFCFLTGNSDMHLKNFSLIEDKAGSRIFGLSAAYDLLPVNVILPTDKEQVALTLNGKKRNLRRKDFLALADNLGITDKTSVGLIRQLLNLKGTFIEMVNCSYIPEDMKVSFTELIEKRAEVLS